MARTDLEVREFDRYSVVIGPVTSARGHRGILGGDNPLILVKRSDADKLLERLQQLESCSLLDLDHYVSTRQNGTWGTIIKMPMQFANMVKV